MSVMAVVESQRTAGRSHVLIGGPVRALTHVVSGRSPLRLRTASKNALCPRAGIRHDAPLSPRRVLILALALLAMTGLAGPAHAAVDLVPVGSFASPVQVLAAPGDDTRLFVVEQGGQIEVVHPDGSRTVFLDVSASLSANS